jgi:signal transduction histidine kinase
MKSENKAFGAFLAHIKALDLSEREQDRLFDLVNDALKEEACDEKMSLLENQVKAYKEELENQLDRVEHPADLAAFQIKEKLESVEDALNCN